MKTMRKTIQIPDDENTYGELLSEVRWLGSLGDGAFSQYMVDHDIQKDPDDETPDFVFVILDLLDRAKNAIQEEI